MSTGIHCHFFRTKPCLWCRKASRPHQIGRTKSNLIAHDGDAFERVWDLIKNLLEEIPIALRENRQWKPAVAYCRYADDFVVIVKGTKAHAEMLREECREFLEDRLKLKLNIEKTHITHVNDGFIFLGHRVIRKRAPTGRMSVVTNIPKEKAKGFAHKLTQALSGEHDTSAVDMIDRLNRQLAGWATFSKLLSVQKGKHHINGDH